MKILESYPPKGIAPFLAVFLVGKIVVTGRSYNKKGELMPIYMKYEGVAGTGKGKRKDWIEVESCQLGLTKGKGVSTPDVSVTKSNDSSSVHLLEESFKGTSKKVTVEFAKADGTVYMKVELEGVTISSYTVSGRGGDHTDRPTETFVLSYTQITYETMAADSKSSKDKAVWTLVPSK